LLLDDQHAAAQALFEELAARLQELPTFQSHRASVEAALGLLALTRGDDGAAASQLNGALHSPQLLYGFVYVATQHGLARLAAWRYAGRPRDTRPRARLQRSPQSVAGICPHRDRDRPCRARLRRPTCRAAAAADGGGSGGGRGAGPIGGGCRRAAGPAPSLAS